LWRFSIVGTFDHSFRFSRPLFHSHPPSSMEVFLRLIAFVLFLFFFQGFARNCVTSHLFSTLDPPFLARAFSISLKRGLVLQRGACLFFLNYPPTREGKEGFFLPPRRRNLSPLLFLRIGMVRIRCPFYPLQVAWLRLLSWTSELQAPPLIETMNDLFFIADDPLTFCKLRLFARDSSHPNLSGIPLPPSQEFPPLTQGSPENFLGFAAKESFFRGRLSPFYRDLFLRWGVRLASFPSEQNVRKIICLAATRGWQFYFALSSPMCSPPFSPPTNTNPLVFL